MQGRLYMARTATRVKVPQAPPSETFVFEIGAWKPSYSLSVDRNKDRDGPYSEHVGIEIETSCVFPKKLSGRPLVFNIWGKRDCLSPQILQSNPDWVPNCVGLLALPPTSGRFYTALPNDSLGIVTTCLAHGLYRFIILYGPPLKWGKSPCSSMQWEQTFNPDDF
jgi:hypothetical protein